MPPEKIKPAPGENPLAAFHGDEAITPDQYPVLDRSTLEQWATCPAQAALVASGTVNTSSAIANAGVAVHDAFSAAIGEWIEWDGHCSRRHLKDFLDDALTRARPDVQPDAIRGAKAAVYSWSEMICGSPYDEDKNGIAPDNILHFDGGEEYNRSGQLAYDFDDLKCRVTSEVDFLAAARATPDVLYEVDIKSGHKLVTTDVVRDSFQFGMHALLVFHKYPECKVLRVIAWNTRTNRRSWAFEFRRDDFVKYRNRVHTAAGIWHQHHTLPPEMCPTWPEVYKCSICDAAHLCPAVENVPVIGEWAGDMLRRYIALSATTKRVKDWLTTYTDRHGDVKLDSGECFGRVATTKPTCKLYQQKEGQE